MLDLDHAYFFSAVMLGITYLSIGDHEAAMPLFEQVCKATPSHPSPHFCRVCAHGLRGDIETGTPELERLMKRIEGSHFSHFNLAMAQTCLGDSDRAHASLEYAAQERDVLFVSLPAHFLFDRYREEPRHLGLLRRYGLPLLPPFENRSLVTAKPGAITD